MDIARMIAETIEAARLYRAGEIEAACALVGLGPREVATIADVLDPRIAEAQAPYVANLLREAA